ncbi:hypothetical protein RT717_00640 [Imperialibacter roseus]|uniref:CHRD domain-containing protein n=1 Tax=Imperialibacter roseus TaxID=1324217 RepID=A0ABZ0IQX9_9BACT|nr:hypothetical protein [Imperialibacter roseus]WOK07126.1 hypothetical protein RT717_00640 [Imperialibacter roseus]
MKKYHILVLVIGLLAMVACKDEEIDPAALTGKSVTYSLFTGAQDWGYKGDATLAERNDGNTLLTIELTGPSGTTQFPAHLHYGAYSLEADMAAMLTPVDAATGKSETLLTQLANGDEISYDELINFDGHIKVHLGDGDNKSVILAYGNIGSNPATANAANVANCASW